MNNLSISIPDWEEIDTAPKSGLIELWCDGRRFTGCYYDRICDEYRTTGTAGILQRLKNPTHWRPEPPAPGQPNPYKEAIRLMIEAIETAPHYLTCAIFSAREDAPCNCWKSQTLTKVTTLFNGEGV